VKVFFFNVYLVSTYELECVVFVFLCLALSLNIFFSSSIYVTTNDRISLHFND
jgi:hypothetical protein